MRSPLAVNVVAVSLLTAACGDGLGQGVEEVEAIPYADGSQEARAILAVANDPSLGVAEYDDGAAVGLDARAAQNLVAHRDGDPTTAEDDNPFDDLTELWSVPYCKAACLHQLLDYAVSTGVYDALGAGARVVFSPQAMEASHLAEAARLIDGARHSIDIAMYSYSHQAPVRGALERALARGVKIRFLADTDLANSASKAGGLEALGIDVRRVTKIMHHKLAIVDGPRDDASLDRAGTATLITGSGNWSSSAATLYDENTVVLPGGYPELALRVQRDFDTLWAGSKDVIYNDALAFDPTRATITDELIAQHEDPSTHAYFTSANFAPTSSQGWSYLGTTAVTDRLVAAILGAEQSLEIASGHFVSVPIAQAVVDAMAARPGLQVRIALDCQESSKGGAPRALKDQIEQRGGSIYYKCNTYRWHYTFAAQMHHKYVIVDGDELYTGSLNFSDNAEINTFENMLYFGGPAHATLVQSFRDNFEHVRAYGREGDLAALQALRNEIVASDSVPLTWSPPISMDLADFLALKDLIREHCPATNLWEGTGAAKTYSALFTNHASWFARCNKTGYPWPQVPEHLRK